MALKAKCGFISAPGTRTSKRVADGGTEGGDIMRMEAARESYPYVTALGAQKASPPTNLLYPLTVGTSCAELSERNFCEARITYHGHNYEGM